jgi:uncharacterized protein DUF928
MRLHFCFALLIPFSVFAQTPPAGANGAAAPGSASHPTQQKPIEDAKNAQQTKSKLKRQYTDLSGFELSPKSDTHGMQIGGGTRGFGGETTLYAPNKAKAYDLHPVFKWTHPSKAQKFLFVLKDSGGATVFQKEVNGRDWRYADDAPALQPGATYSWTVEPTVSLLGPPSEPAEILVFGGAERSQILEELSKVGLDDPARADIFVRHRSWYDAVEFLSNLIKQNPSRDRYEKRAEIYEQAVNTKPLADEDRTAAMLLTGKH